MRKAEGSTSEPQCCLIGGLVALGLAVAVPAGAASDNLFEPDHAREQVSVSVAPGQAELRRYFREPRTVIVGDPGVVAASIAGSDILVLTGLASGETNVIVLDDGGAQIDHIALRVTEPGSTIVVRRGQERELLRCDPVCAPLGESGLTAPATSLPANIGASIAEETTSQP